MKRITFLTAIFAVFSSLLSCTPEEKEQSLPELGIVSLQADVEKAVALVSVKNSDCIHYSISLAGGEQAEMLTLPVDSDGEYEIEIALGIQEPGTYDYVFSAYSSMGGAKVSETVTKEVSVTKEEEIFELKGGVSNCYIIDPLKYNRFTFSPAVRVNQFWGDAANGGVQGDHPSVSGDGDGYIASGNLDNVLKESDEWYLEVLWADTPDYEKFVFGQTEQNPGKGNQEAVISFKDVTEEGNIIIGLKKKDQDFYLWSWHLWVTSYNPEEDMVALPEVFEGALQEDFINHGRMIMGRDLGALCNEAGNPKSIGLLYQWGRKDPFIAPDAWGDTDMTYKYPVEMSQSYETDGTLLKCVMNPQTIYYSADVFTSAESIMSGHLSAGNGANRWGGCASHTDPTWTENEKTIYDPCPEGWRVPAGRYWAGFKATWDSEIKGYKYETTYFPASGFVLGSSKELMTVGDMGYYWSASTFSPTAPDLASTAVVSPEFIDAVAYSAYGAQKHNACPVRPIKEK